MIVLKIKKKKKKKKGIYSGSSSPESNWNLEVLIFYGGRKTGEPGEKPRDRGENQQQTQLTCDNESENPTWVTVVRGKCTHRYATHASQHIIV
jgi:hypothetical protein